MSSPIRMTGLTSGLDTESIVTALVSNYQTKVDKYKKAQTKLSWTQDAWSNVNKKVKSLYSSLDAMRFSSGYSLQKASVSDATKASVSASGKAFNGTHTLSISSTASAASLTSAKLSDTSGTTMLSELGYSSSSGGTVNVNIGDKTTAITVNGSTTVTGFVNQLKNAGLNANYDSNNGRIYISSKSTGSANNFTLTAADSNGISALQSLGLYANSSDTQAQYQGLAKYYASADSTKSVDGNTYTSTSSYVEQLLQDYNSASTTSSANTASYNNLNAASSYAQSYYAVQDAETELNSYGVSSTDKYLAALTASSSNALIDDSNNIYEPAYTDSSTGAVYYSTTGTDGTETYFAKVATYNVTDSDGSTTEYISNGDGTYSAAGSSTKYKITETDGNVTLTNADDSTDTVTGTGKAGYTILQASKTTDSDGNATYSHTTDEYTGISGLELASEAVSDFETSLAANDSFKSAATSSLDSAATDDEKTAAIKSKISSLKSTITTGNAAIKAYESEDDSTATANNSDSIYTRSEIEELVKNGYRNGTTVDTLSADFGTYMTANKTAMNAANTTLSTYSELSDLAELYANKSTDSDAYTTALNNFVSKVEFANTALGSLSSDTSSTGALKTVGTDATITLDGVDYSSDTNNFSINGLNINTLAKTTDDITITTQTDTDGLYDKIKDFISDYNDVINELTDLYNADSASGYEPLTDDEKEKMTDSEVEKWETKIKKSLLRRDDTLDGLMSSMESAMSSSFKVTLKDGSTATYSLSTFGIQTQSILQADNNRQNAYHIAGDEDDDQYSTKTDKLKSQINSDPDAFISFFTQLTNKLSTNLKNKMTSTSLRSAYSIYNDKEMASEYSDYTDLINQWQTRLNDAEDRYYKQFSKMESSLSTLQSSVSSLGFSS